MKTTKPNVAAHIRETTYECQATKDTRTFNRSTTMLRILVGVVATIFVCGLAASIAYAASQPAQVVGKYVANDTSITLTLSNESACHSGEYGAVRSVSATVTQYGCWMQPTPQTVSIRWKTPASIRTSSYRIADFTGSAK